MAGLGRRTFAPGEVLTSSNVMNYLMDQSIMNFAGTAARGSAIGTAVSEGMVSYLADSNDVEVYTGAAWSPVAFESYVDGKPVAGLVPIIAPTVNFSGGTATANSLGTISFSGVTSISLNNAFSSSYQHYKIIAKYHASTTSTVRFRWRSAGTDRTVGAYYSSGFIGRANSTGIGSFNANATTSLDVGRTETTADQRSFTMFECFDPFVSTRATGHIFQWQGQDASGLLGGFGNGGYLQSIEFDGFTFFIDSGNFTGTIQVFGYND